MQILDLRHFSAPALRPLLKEESETWRTRLRWDYRASARLLLDYLDSRVLPGYVAVRPDGTLAGYVFCVYEGTKAVIGDVFGSARVASTPDGAAGPARAASDQDDTPDVGEDAPSSAAIEAELLTHVIELLTHSPGVHRIETQLLLHPHGQHGVVFSHAGFQIYERLFMERPLGDASESDLDLPPEVELRGWREEDFSPAGDLICEAYRGHLDSLINDQYRTVAGSLRFLHNIVRFPGCGVFDSSSSLVLAYRGRSDLAGVLLCSRVSENAGHITQVCLAPSLRRRGLGRALLSRAFGKLREAGLEYVTLTVTKGNAEAAALYLERGFTVRHRFDAVVWERRLTPVAHEQ